MTTLSIDVSDVPLQPLVQKDVPGKNGVLYVGVKKSKDKWIGSVAIAGKEYHSRVQNTQEEAAQWRAKVHWKYILGNKSSSKDPRKVSLSPEDTTSNKKQKCN
jgi:hypothetical protein